jgi:hypothetical protein
VQAALEDNPLRAEVQVILLMAVQAALENLSSLTKRIRST